MGKFDIIIKCRHIHGCITEEIFSRQLYVPGHF